MRKALTREMRKKSTAQVTFTYLDVTCGPMVYYDDKGNIIGGSKGDDYLQFVPSLLDFRMIRPDGTRLVNVGAELVEV